MPETTRPSRTEIVDQAYQLDFDRMRAIVAGCGGWLRSSGGEHGDEAQVWFEDVEYIFRGRGLVEFLYAVKDHAQEVSYEAKDLVEYILQAEKQPASVFVRDAIVARAKSLKAKFE